MAFALSDVLRKKEHQNLSGKLRPSGRFSVIQLFPKKSKTLNHAKKEPVRQGNLRSLRQIDESHQAILAGRFSVLPEMSTTDGNSEGTIGLSDEAISPKRSRRGSKGIGTRQRDVLCWGAGAIESVYGRRNLSFLTYTLPPLTPEDLAAVKENWADIVNRIQLRIKEKLHECGIKTTIAGCVELQLERYQDTGDVYPHLHLVFRGRRDGRSDWGIKPHQFRQIWRRCVSKFLSGKKYDWRASENVEQVRRSVAGYLAKYISKCASKAEPELLSAWHPRDWILVSRQLRKLYEQMSYTGFDVAQLLSDVVRSWEPSFGYVSRVFISTIAYGERCIGYAGWLRGETRFPSYSAIHCVN